MDLLGELANNTRKKKLESGRVGSPCGALRLGIFIGMGPLVARPRVLGLPPGVNVKLSIYLISLDPRDFAMRPLERLSLVHSSLALRLLLLCQKPSPSKTNVAKRWVPGACSNADATRGSFEV